MTERDQEEQDLRIDPMTVNIEKMRADLAIENKNSCCRRWASAPPVLQPAPV
nr:hypothetical protein [uncultured Rhodopila sp.]